MVKGNAKIAKPEDQQVGKYYILKKLAVGGMAEIYLARATGIQGFEKHVVLKRILPEHAKDARFVEMFLDEARLAARLHHHNIAQVYDIGQSGGAYFFSMEYLHGEDLRSVLKTVATMGQKVPLRHVLTIIAGAAAGLHYAHEKKGSNGQPLTIVHRDISPSNIVATYDGGVKVVDFGIARATERSTETRSGSLKGKISYMSPEQCVGRDLDRRSDIFCLGIVMYELSTVTRLFRAQPDESDYVVMDRIVNGKFDPPSLRVKEYPPELEAIVMKALTVDRNERYATAKDMLIDIENFAAQERIPLSPAGLSRYLEEVFGSRPEPWHTTNQSIIVPDKVEKTVSTTGTVAPYQQSDGPGLEGTILTVSQMGDPTDKQDAVPVHNAYPINSNSLPAVNFQPIGSNSQVVREPDVQQSISPVNFATETYHIRPSNKKWWWTLGLCLLAIAGIVIYSNTQSTEGTTPPEVTTGETSTNSVTNQKDPLQTNTTPVGSSEEPTQKQTAASKKTVSKRAAAKKAASRKAASKRAASKKKPHNVRASTKTKKVPSETTKPLKKRPVRPKKGLPATTNCPPGIIC